MKKIQLILLMLLFNLVVKAQQDAQYSQYMFNGIYINPAYAGYKEQLNIHSFYRNQWTGINGSPKGMSLAIDASANNRNVGLAFQVSSDKLGAQSSVAAYANYAYRLKVGNDENSRLAFGVGAGLVQNGVDGDMLNPIDQGDIRIPNGMQTNTLPDARAGIFFSNDKLYAGFSVDNLVAQYTVKQNNAEVYYPTQKAHYYLTAGLLIPFSQTLQLKPSFLLKDDRGGPTSLDINAFFLFADKIWLGGSYRTAVNLYDKSYLQRDLEKRNAVVAMAEVFPSQQLRIGYAFDYTLSKLSGYSGGSHEISIGFYFKSKSTRMVSPRYF